MIQGAVVQMSDVAHERLVSLVRVFKYQIHLNVFLILEFAVNLLHLDQEKTLLRNKIFYDITCK